MISNQKARKSLLSTVNSVDEDLDDEVASAGGKTAEDSESTTSSGLSGSDFALRETKMVNRSKALMYSVILCCTCIIGGVTYWFMESEQVAWYENEFDEFSGEIFKFTRGKLKKIEEANFALATAWATNAKDTEGSLVAGNVSIPNFGAMGSSWANLVNTEFLGFAPLVQAKNRAEWESYAKEHQSWIADGLAFESILKHGEDVNVSQIPFGIVGDNEEQEAHLPVWQIYPAPENPSQSPVMLDLLGLDWFVPLWQQVLATRASVYSPVIDLDFLLNYTEFHDDKANDFQYRGLRYRESFYGGASDAPKSLLLTPIHETLDHEISPVAGVAISVIDWKTIFSGILRDEAEGMVIDLAYDCASSVSTFPRHAFETTNIEGEVVYVGKEYPPDISYIHLKRTEGVTGTSGYHDVHDEDPSDLHDGFCGFNASTYATDTFVKNWQRDDATVFTIIVCSNFLFTGLVFFVYDFMVQRRNRKVLKSAARSNAIVTSLFPKNVARQMMEDEEERQATQKFSAARLMKTFSAAGGGVEPLATKKPIADMFKNVTIMFGDISGFTAWSSMREPAQVFHLLETIFNAFDTIADNRRVFKVETVGDCYVAVAGLPDPRPDHAVVMARFAWECLLKMGELSQKLELELGPDTSLLSMRFGLHSGPVTAGVLRGQRARFQLFGDSMNKASRIETSGMAGRVHVSKETADNLAEYGKTSWLTKREDVVTVKGLGELTTYWLSIPNGANSRTSTADSTSTSSRSTELIAPRRRSHVSTAAQQQSLIIWHKDLLSSYLKKIIALREHYQGINGEAKKRRSTMNEKEMMVLEREADFGYATPNHCIAFPVVDAALRADMLRTDTVALDESVSTQLGLFVAEVAALYNAENPFHNFKHASHVVMSVTKLMSYIESSSNLSLDDPMTQFVAVLAALVHDLDHPGVGNEQLRVEGHTFTKLYENSVAERNSLDMTWDLLRQEQFLELRRAIYQTESEFERFRELLVHCLLVTDIMDKGQQQERKKRWEKIFGDGKVAEPSEANQELINMQKTALLEHVIQASDVAHTMQHWTVYQHWNRRLFQEMDKAFKAGRGKTDPAANWYKGEIGFFDFYIIPLAERLKKCPAFGASGDELLQYALSNRKEWETKGRAIVQNYMDA